MTDDAKAKPKLNMIGQPEPVREQPMEPLHANRPMGERQDGAGAGPYQFDRHDAVPAGSTAHRRAGGGLDGQGKPEEPDAGHRGQPAPYTTRAAIGSGSGAGGTGIVEEPDSDSAGGGGRKRGFAAARKRRDRHPQ